MTLPSKRYLVLDAYVIATASAFSVKCWKAIEILCRIIEVCHRIVLDLERPDEDNIIDEYRRQATAEVTKRWIVAMQARADKVAYRPRASVVISALSDPDDLKYIQVAVNSPHRIIVSEDSDLTNIANHPDITSKGIAVWDLDLALASL